MNALPIQLDRSSPVPLYHQLAEQLTAAITDGRLRPGDPFENEIGMSDRLNLSRPTVRRAISELVNQGLLVRRRGIGTTVANQMVHRKAELTSLYDDLAREGRTPRTEVLALDCAAQDDRAAAVLEVPPGTPLVGIVRLRYADDLPLAIMRNWLPPALNDLTLDELTTDGLYAVLRARGIRPTVARQRIGARNATAEERRTLHMSKAEPLITMTRSAYAADGSPVEYGNHCYRADQYSVDVVVSER
ncbi:MULTISPECIES: GntR family transcriptional regulator [Kribbella]|jgi:GntR family transcriptional regulator|uniref:GntR family transcriptional regulator n=1 Tax=Kribbella pratensis TaxID=2512112 RepID=A0ABY2FQE3_9ACTN|nr:MULTISPECIES: GntR family transcriptional regulator [Kribbella]TDW95361.1 GntR family transcriptional regulator [Kribbella pratensis]TDX03972.1 GntR family transcriptional regulator [Kribbella sp. VKM Ac-2566]